MADVAKLKNKLEIQTDAKAKETDVLSPVSVETIAIEENNDAV